MTIYSLKKNLIRSAVQIQVQNKEVDRLYQLSVEQEVTTKRLRSIEENSLRKEFKNLRTY